MTPTGTRWVWANPNHEWARYYQIEVILRFRCIGLRVEYAGSRTIAHGGTGHYRKGTFNNFPADANDTWGHSAVNNPAVLSDTFLKGGAQLATLTRGR